MIETGNTVISSPSRTSHPGPYIQPISQVGSLSSNTRLQCDQLKRLGIDQGQGGPERLPEGHLCRRLLHPA